MWTSSLATLTLTHRPLYLSPSHSSFISAPLKIRPFFSSSNLQLKSKSKSNSTKKKNGSPTLRCDAQLLDDIAPAASAAYGTLLLGGGLFAYARSGSKGSILGGLSGAALMAAAYYLMQSPETKQAGDALGFGSAFLFAAVFGIRLASTRKLIPSGLLLLLSVGSLAVFYSAYIQDKIPQDIGPM